MINDLNSEVVNFFQVLRKDAGELVRQITLTPYSRAELEIAYIPAEGDMERARRFYVRAWQSYTASEAPKSRGWRWEINQTRGLDDWNRLDNLYKVAARLKRVMIECKPALRTIEEFDDTNTLLYCDPPYVADVRSGNREYKDEMTNADHIALSDALHSIKGMALISGYDSALYRTLYKDWACVTKKARTVGNVIRIEHLWISPNAQGRQAQKRLF